MKKIKSMIKQKKGPCVTIKKPHYVWPEIDKKINKKVFDYLNNYKSGKNGLPDVIEKFEKKFSNFHKVNFSLCQSSCTAALHTAYNAIGIKKGDEVIISNYTFPATALPLLLIGAKPILCDVDPKTANIDPNLIENKITKKTKAICVTHWWGLPCEMEEIVRIKKKYNLFLIEDCAHAPGARYKKKLVGTFGEFGCFSFDNNKLLASGEGGMLITNDKKLFQKSIILSDFGPRLSSQVKDSNLKKFVDTGLGTKYRINFMAAKMAYEKFKLLKKFNSDRQKIFDYFCLKLNQTSSILSPFISKNLTRGGFYGFKVTIKKDFQKKINLKRFISLLQKEGVDVRKTLTPPLHMTKLFKDVKKDFICSEWFHRNHLSFPVFYKKDHKKIIDQYLNAIKKVESKIL